MALCPFANWRGPVPNRTVNGMSSIYGLVLHIQEGTEQGTDAWFHQDAAQASSHFGNPKIGKLDQWVSTDDMAWAEVSGNSNWVSLENEGHSGDSLTSSQIENAAQLLAWLHKVYQVPLRITDSVSIGGLGWHGMGGNSWGGHFDCPGDPIKKQRTDILVRTQAILAGSSGQVFEDYPTIQLGDRGFPVADAQQLLGVEPDGDFGKQTYSAVVAFQKRNNLTSDGIVGVLTWAKLHHH